jgi:hypothetical protein
MPCNSLRSTSVDLTALGRIDAELLTQAFQSLGLGGRLSADKSRIDLDSGAYTLSTGKLETYGRSVTLDRVKQAYGAEVVKSTAKRYGWGIKQVGQFAYNIIKR